MKIEGKLSELLAQIPMPTHYIVDIGASTGPSSDPVHTFLKSGEYAGLCIEASEEKMDGLREAYPSSAIVKVNTFATPTTIQDTFDAYSVPNNPDILKIDIDGYDLSVLKAILERKRYKPSIIVAEINEKIPPPIYFEVKYSPEWKWDESHCFGFSIQAGYNLLSQHDYCILGIYDLNNIIAVRKDMFRVIEESIETIYTRDFIENPERHTFWWNVDVEDWIEAKLENDLEYLENKIRKYFTSGLKKGSAFRDDVFLLYVDEI